MTRPVEYTQFIKAVDAYLVRAGVRKACIDCHSKPHGLYHYGSCCQGCEYNQNKGCVDKGIPCTLYLCYGHKKSFPLVAATLEMCRFHLRDAGIRTEDYNSFEEVVQLQKSLLKWNWTRAQLDTLSAMVTFLEAQ